MILANVGNATSGLESVTSITLLENKGAMVRYMNRIIPTQNYLERTYSVHQYRIVDVSTPTNKGDAVNLETLDSTFKPCFKLNADGTMYNADGIRINSVGLPSSGEDAVNLVVVEAKVNPCLELNSNGTVYNADII